MILDKIVARKREQLELLKKGKSIEDWKQCLRLSEGRVLEEDTPFEQALKSHDISIIAEIKKASPSKGVLRKAFEPVELARQYEEAGASAVSVLTEEFFFQGCSEYLSAVKEKSSLPVLRKDFIIDPWQIYEAQSIGADAILLIAAILDDMQLMKYQIIARILGMASLVEVHDEIELKRALASGARIIGINNRNLHTFEVDLTTTAKLMQHIPGSIIKVSESGIMNRGDMEYLMGLGVDAVLIGESFMRASSITDKMAELMGRKEFTA